MKGINGWLKGAVWDFYRKLILRSKWGKSIIFGPKMNTEVFSKSGHSFKICKKKPEFLLNVKCFVFLDSLYVYVCVC